MQHTSQQQAELRDRWFEQGFLAAQMGLPEGDGAAWSPAHRDGWKAARRGERVEWRLAGTPAMLRSVTLNRLG